MIAGAVHYTHTLTLSPALSAQALILSLYGYLRGTVVLHNFMLGVGMLCWAAHLFADVGWWWRRQRQRFSQSELAPQLPAHQQLLCRVQQQFGPPHSRELQLTAAGPAATASAQGVQAQPAVSRAGVFFQ
eukprot:scaffold36748_cov17-Tisochrysis_lutea.AAC.3